MLTIIVNGLKMRGIYGYASEIHWVVPGTIVKN